MRRAPAALAAAEAPRLEQGHAPPGTLEQARRGQPRDAAPDDCYVNGDAALERRVARRRRRISGPDGARIRRHGRKVRSRGSLSTERALTGRTRLSKSKGQVG